MSMKYLSASVAAAVDKELMSTEAFSLDQLMELAGLAVAQAVHKVHPPERGTRVLVLAGPGNNGGDGLVAARHLALWGYAPAYYYPAKSRHEHLVRLETQLRRLGVPELGSAADVLVALGQQPGASSSTTPTVDHVIDALFGFSFRPPVRAPFDEVIAALQRNTAASPGVPVTAVDIPSSWDVDSGPAADNAYAPEVLVSLTGPKPAAAFFTGRHFVGGRFISREFAAKWDFEVPRYEGVDQVVEVARKAAI